MLLNAVEKALMNNPVRAAIRRHFEARRLLDLGGHLAGDRALESFAWFVAVKPREAVAPAGIGAA